MLGAYSIRIQSHHLLATIALKGEGFIRHIKERSDVHLLELTRDNRESLPEAIVERGVRTQTEAPHVDNEEGRSYLAHR